MENIKSCTGKIYFTSFEEARDILKENDNFDIKLHITRHKNKGLLKDFIHVPQLAPSNELFNEVSEDSPS